MKKKLKSTGLRKEQKNSIQQISPEQCPYTLKLIKLVSDVSFSSLCSLTKKDRTSDGSKPTYSHFHIYE